jgi:dipeptidyl aminopeptidase/acylaminoacyl peptidase
VNLDAIRSSRGYHLALIAAALFLSSVGAHAQAGPPATAKKALTIDDYSRWRSINDQEISTDGRWVSYVLRFANTKPEDTKPVLHILDLETSEDIEVPNGTGGTFSKDSRWIAYQVDPGAEGGVGDAQEPEDERRHAELRSLETGMVRSWANIQSFAFSNNSTHLVLRRHPPQEAEGGSGRGGRSAGGGGDTSGGPRGVDVIVHDLATGRDLFLGSVGDISFNEEGNLLAYTVDAAVNDANGLAVIDLESGRTHALDNDAQSYNRMTWSEDGEALAVLKGSEVEGMRERDNVLLTFPDVRAALADDQLPSQARLDPTTADGFPEGWVVSDRATLRWSADNARVYFGIKAQVEEPDTTGSDSDEVANVDVWNTLDERIQSLQMRRASADRDFTYRQAFDITAGTFIKLADGTMRDLEVAPEGRWAVGRDTRGYIHDYNPAAADIYRVDTSTGVRTLMLSNHLTGRGLLGFSADGRYYLYWSEEKVHAYDLDEGTHRALGGATAPSFIDVEDDHAGPTPSYGIAGYTKDGTAAVARTRYDLWLLPFDGSDARSLTHGEGAEKEIRFRYVDLDPEDPPGGGRRGGSSTRTIDLSKPVVFSAYGQWTKRSGFYELADDSLTEIVYEDAMFSTPAKAKMADKFLFTRQTFAEFPDLRVSGRDLGTSVKITAANPQQTEYQWGHSILFDFENKDGVRLQGILAVPDDYQPGEKRAMLVTFYEKSSQGLHRYIAPSYLTGMGSSPIQAVSEGYLTMRPDIHFRTGASPSDMLECVEAAVRKVIEMGFVDPERVGITGHSYGGQGVAFIGVRSDMFAAIGMGAGVTDMTFDFNQNWGWAYDIDGGSGANAPSYYLHGQGRQATSPWEDPELYRFESALTHVPDAEAPFLIMHGTSDPTVAFQHALGLYNAMRFNGKSAVLLAYPGEGHGLRRIANRKDLTVRYFEFFNHHLKGAAAPEWMSEGVPFLKKSRR